MGIILLFKNPEDELKYLEFKRQKRIKRIHLIKKLLTCLKEEDFELYRHFIANHKTFKQLLKSSIQYYINRWFAPKKNLEIMEYILTEDTLHIKDSYLVESEEDMILFLNKVMSESNTDTIVWKLPISEMVNEWKGHNLLYYFGLFQSRTKDVDINKNSWILRFGYKILAKIYDCFMY